MISHTDACALGENSAYVQAKAKLTTLQSEYSALIADYTELTVVIKGNLETEYMLKIGKKEFELFSLKLSYQRLKRKITLCQAAKNRNEPISEIAIEAKLNEEFAAFLKQLDEQQARVKAAEEHFKTPKLSAEKSLLLKKRYHALVKKIHPDLRPELPPLAQVLWERVLEAYQLGDLDEFALLEDMVNELLDGNPPPLDKKDPLTHVLNECEKLSHRISKLQQQLHDIQEYPPFSYRTLLENPAELLERRKALAADIESVKAAIHHLETIYNALKG